MTEHRERFEKLVERIQQVAKEECGGLHVLESFIRNMTLDDLSGILWAKTRIDHMEKVFRVSPDTATFEIGMDDCPYDVGHGNG